MVWYMMPTSPQPGAPELSWEVAVERANATQCTYWITVRNLTSNTITFEGRYAVLT
jgi:glycyl-tRNA synthetase alpha subunit